MPTKELLVEVTRLVQTKGILMREIHGCAFTGVCTDYPMKCSECAKNKAKSYFEPKEAED